MADEAFKLIPEATALQAAPGFAPAEEGAPAPAAGQTPVGYLASLASGGHFSTGFGFLAAALPVREAVWWACRCAREALGPEPTREADAALKATETWAVSPGDINRRKAMAAAESEAVGFGHPAGCAGLAAFLSGGSLVPPGLKEVPPPAHAFTKAVVGSILLAAAKTDPRTIAQTHQKFLGIGLAVARGEDRWKSPT